MIDEPLRGRFAPSPTGLLHFGSLIAAIGSYFECKTRQGQWLLRIEDLDRYRTVPGAADRIMRTLETFGLYWDGPVLYQSQRTAVYQVAFNTLDDAGLLYPCSCSRREIALEARTGIEGPVYPGYCRTDRRHPERTPAWRLRTDSRTICFNDRIQGDTQQNVGTGIGDFIVRRADGLFAYQLAVVVDDAAQGITDIVRGADLLGSTPRQILLQQFLQLPTPHYAHLPLAVDGQGRKLSKQFASAPVDPDRPAPAFWQALRFLGQRPPPDLESGPIQALHQWTLAHWSTARIPNSPQIVCPG